MKEGGDKTGTMARGVKVQPTIAQRRSLRVANQGKILEQATKLKAQKNEVTGKSQFTAFTSQPSDKLSKVAKICKIKLGNETEAHLAIDRLKAHEAAKAAILEAKQKVQQSQKQNKQKVQQSQKQNISPNRFAVLEVEHDIEEVICEVADDQIEEISKEVFQKESEHKKMKAPRGAG
jgi:hypothetical protein